MWRDIIFEETPFLLVSAPIVFGEGNKRRVEDCHVMVHAGLEESMQRLNDSMRKPSNATDKADANRCPVVVGSVAQCVYRNGRRTNELFLQRGGEYVPLSEYIRDREMLTSSPGPNLPVSEPSGLKEIWPYIYAPGAQYFEERVNLT